MTRLWGEGVVWPVVATRDDRGRAWRTRVDVEAIARRPSTGDADARAAIARRLRSESTTMFGIAMIFILASRISGLEDRVQVAGVAGDVAVVAVTLGLFWPVLVLMHRRQMGVHRRAALALGVCPVCGHSTADFEPQPDHCRVCPECGSAWKLDGD